MKTRPEIIADVRLDTACTAFSAIPQRASLAMANGMASAHWKGPQARDQSKPHFRFSPLLALRVDANVCRKFSMDCTVKTRTEISANVRPDSACAAFPANS